MGVCVCVCVGGGAGGGRGGMRGIKKQTILTWLHERAQFVLSQAV